MISLLFGLKKKIQNLQFIERTIQYDVTFKMTTNQFYGHKFMKKISLY